MPKLNSLSFFHSKDGIFFSQSFVLKRRLLICVCKELDGVRSTIVHATHVLLLLLFVYSSRSGRKWTAVVLRPRDGCLTLTCSRCHVLYKRPRASHSKTKLIDGDRKATTNEIRFFFNRIDGDDTSWTWNRTTKNNTSMICCSQSCDLSQRKPYRSKTVNATFVASRLGGAAASYLLSVQPRSTNRWFQSYVYDRLFYQHLKTSSVG